MIRALIQDRNWRRVLVGNAAVILLRAGEFENDLFLRLAQGSWVAPQLAVGLALVSNGSTVPALEKLIDEATEEESPFLLPPEPLRLIRHTHANR